MFATTPADPVEALDTNGHRNPQDEMPPPPPPPPLKAPEEPNDAYAAILAANYVQEHNRHYARMGNGKYPFPADEVELKRIDLFNQIARDVLGEDYWCPAFSVMNPRVLDLGSGTGIWAMGIAESPNIRPIEVVGVDISYIQPKRTPINTRFIKMDIEALWHEIGSSLFDLIHARFLAGAIRDWSFVFRQAAKTLRPGGAFALVDFDWDIRFDERGQIGVATRHWINRLHTITSERGRPLKLEPELIHRQLHESRLTVHRYEVHQVNIGRPSPERYQGGENTPDRTACVGFIMSLEAMSVRPLLTWGRMNIREYQDLIAEVTREIWSEKIFMYMQMHVWEARNVPIPPQDQTSSHGWN